MVNAGLARERAEQTRGVEPRAGAEHAALGKTDVQRELTGDDVAGVGDVDEHAVKAACLELLGVAAHGGNGKVHLGHAVMCAAQQLDLADAVDDDVARAEVGEVTGADGDAVGQIRDGVAQVLHLARELLLVLVDEHQLIRDALDRQRVGDVRADVAKTDDA